MDIKAENLKVFNDTLKQINSDKMLNESIQKSVMDSKVYIERYKRLNKPENPQVIGPANVKVTKNSSFNAARSYSGNIAVLNFASATNPGGGVTKGSNAQEECLCRCSTLYPILSDNRFLAFYSEHKTAGNALHNDDIIY